MQPFSKVLDSLLSHWKHIEFQRPFWARLERRWGGVRRFLFLGHDVLCGIQVGWVTKHENCETETVALDTFSRECCDKAVVPSFGDMRFSEQLLG